MSGNKKSGIAATPPGPSSRTTGVPLQKRKDKDEAWNLVDRFEASKSGVGWFQRYSRKEVAHDLRKVLIDPAKINQAGSLVCGPAAFLYTFAKDSPLAYVKYVTDLYNDGTATLRLPNSKVALKVLPGKHLKAYRPRRVNDTSDAVSPADWIALASLRDSENFNPFTLGAPYFAPATYPIEIKKWLEKVGYQQVIEESCPSSYKTGLFNLNRAKSYADRGYRVMLLISSHTLRSRQDRWQSTHVGVKFKERADRLCRRPPKSIKEQIKDIPNHIANHWVVLSGKFPIKIGPHFIRMRIYSWGGIQMENVDKKNFLTHHYWGFVAAKY